MANVIHWFEIPAIDFAKAIKCYSEVLDVKMSEIPSPDGKLFMAEFIDTEGNRMKCHSMN